MVKLSRFCRWYRVGIQDDNEVRSVLDNYKLISYNVEDVLEQNGRFFSFAFAIV